MAETQQTNEVATAVEAKASGSSFYAAMRLLPAAERAAMFAIYAFCRAVDDIADDGIGTRPERHDALTAWRRDDAPLGLRVPIGLLRCVKARAHQHALRTQHHRGRQAAPSGLEASQGGQAER